MLSIIFSSFFLIVPIFLAIIIVLSVFTVEQQSVAVVERFGKYLRLANPGLNFRIPLIDRIAGRVTLRIQQLDVKAETKTKDNVFVTVIVSVQYFILPAKVYEAFYKLNSPAVQINSYVFDTIRARVPKITLDELFEKKEEIAMAVKEELNETMIDFGFEILNSLVTDIEPDQKVKEAMNEINAAQRLRVAATEKGEAEKIIKVKAAEADAESKALQGRGIANQRMAIIDGLKESVDDFQKSIPGSSAQDVMNLVLMTQYFDTLKEIGADSKTNTLLIPHGPGAMNNLADQLREAMLTANAVNKN